MLFSLIPLCLQIWDTHHHVLLPISIFLVSTLTGSIFTVFFFFLNFIFYLCALPAGVDRPLNQPATCINDGCHGNVTTKAWRVQADVQKNVIRVEFVFTRLTSEGAG